MTAQERLNRLEDIAHDKALALAADLPTYRRLGVERLGDTMQVREVCERHIFEALEEAEEVEV